MMRSREEIKSIAKERFRANYWICVFAPLLITLALNAITFIFSVPTNFSTLDLAGYTDVSDLMDSTLLASIGSIILLIFTGPLSIGLNHFHIMNILGRDVSVGTPFRSAFTNFGRKLGGFLWKVLFLYLWTLLLIIPGIIKSLSYAMSDYILADCPNVKARDALTLSKRIMKGHKTELFVFQLSFLGWLFLNALTFGILGLFYVTPYMNNALATYYLEVREDALRNGVITMGQLEGTEAV